MLVPRPAPPHARAPADDAQAFHFQNGDRARSLEELAAALARAPADVVAFHRAHFAPWLASIVGDEPLARRFEWYAHASLAPELLRETLRDLVDARLRELP